MTQYYVSEYDQWDMKSPLEEARESISSAISMLDDLEDADDVIAEKAAEQAQDFKNDMLEVVKEFAEFQQAMLEWVDDDSDLYTIRQTLSDIRVLIGSGDARPWTSKYSLAVRVRDAVKQLRTARNEEIETHALPTQEG